MIHGTITAGFCLLFIATGLPWPCLFCPAAFYLGREVAQAEDRWLKARNLKRSLAPWWCGFAQESSSALDGAKYRIRVITTSIEGNYKSKTAILDETVEIPDADCTLHELIKKSNTSEQESEAKDAPAGG